MPKAPCLMPVFLGKHRRIARRITLTTCFWASWKQTSWWNAPDLAQWQPNEQKAPHDPQEAPRDRRPAKWGLSL